MDRLLAIKNRYWVMILPLMLFLTRYYLYFVLREPILDKEGLESEITFQSFLVFNFFLGVFVMFFFLFSFFLLMKGVTYLWQDIDSKKLLKALLISYCLFFIPNIAQIIYFTFFDTNFQLADLKEFNRFFYLERESNPFELGSDVFKIILSTVNVTDFIFFISIYVLLHLLFEELKTNSIIAIVFILAIVYFSCIMMIPLLMI